jgi:hypothetical protein
VFETGKAFEGGAGFWKSACGSLHIFLGRRLYLARQKRTTFEARDRPYVTILKSVLATPWIIDPTPEVFAPRVRKNERGASL